jgi:hypothetical protein
MAGDTIESLASRVVEDTNGTGVVRWELSPPLYPPPPPHTKTHTHTLIIHRCLFITPVCELPDLQGALQVAPLGSQCESCLPYSPAVWVSERLPIHRHAHWIAICAHWIAICAHWIAICAHWIAICAHWIAICAHWIAICAEYLLEIIFDTIDLQ